MPPPSVSTTPPAAAAPLASAASSVASKRTAEPVTTARSSKKGRKKAPAEKIGKGRRVFVKKKTLFHIIPFSTAAGQVQNKVMQGLPPYDT